MLTRPLLAGLVLAACAGAPAKRHAPPAIDTTCRILPDGALCDFVNAGGPGATCVRVLLGVTRSGTVVTSDEACSGPLAQNARLLVATRFPVAPGAVCGEVTSCTHKVVDAGVAANAAATWQAELAAARTRAAAAGDEACRELAAHVYGLILTMELDSAGDDAEREQARRRVEEEEPYILDDWRSRCEAATPAVRECVTGARSYPDAERCWR